MIVKCSGIDGFGCVDAWNEQACGFCLVGSGTNGCIETPTRSSKALSGESLLQDKLPVIAHDQKPSCISPAFQSWLNAKFAAQKQKQQAANSQMALGGLQ